MSETEIEADVERVEVDTTAGTQIELSATLPAEDGAGTSAAEKIMRTLRNLSKPDEDAGELELTLSSVAFGIERGLRAELKRMDPEDLDRLVVSLARWMASHRSDAARQLLVVEMPRRENLPAGTRLHLLEEAEQAAERAEQAGSPFS